jgi:hypothetical protein
MNKLSVSFILFAGIASLCFVADPSWEAVSKAFREGNADAIAVHMDANVDMNIIGAESTQTKAQAVQSIKGFFAKNKPKSFNSIHQGSSKGKASCYYIGELDSSGGKFRVYIYFKAVNNVQLIKEIRIDKL